jgi:branched-chain amino acid transport system permease protein
MFALLPQIVVDGLLLGAVYAVVAVGLTMVFGVMRIINFAHGDFLMLGMYLTYVAAVLLGLDPYLSLLLVLPLVTLTAAGTYRLLIKPILGSAEHNQVLVTLGLSLILQNLALVLFSADLHTIPSRLSASKFYLGSVIVRTPAAIACAASIAVSIALYAFLRHSDLGRRIRATAEDRDAAALCGVSVDRTYLVAFCIGTGLLGLVAPLLAPFLYVAPTLGVNFTLTAFIIVVLGGIGSFLGALAGGLLIGLVETVGGLVTSGSMPYLLSYAVFVLVLLFRPAGLFGKARL